MHVHLGKFIKCALLQRLLFTASSITSLNQHWRGKYEVLEFESTDINIFDVLKLLDKPNATTMQLLITIFE